MRAATYSSCSGAVGQADNAARIATGSGVSGTGTDAEYRSMLLVERGKIRRRATLLVGAALLGGACVSPAALGRASASTPAAPPRDDPPPTPPSSATLGTTAVFDEAEVMAGIQQTLDRQAAARSTADRDAYLATIDQRNLTWRRIQGEYFSGETARGPRPSATYRVTRIQPKPLDYVKAWIDVIPPGQSLPDAEAVWVFRPTDEGWLHTEILNEQLGPRKQLETEHFTMLYYEWDDDVIDRIAAVAERTFARVSTKTGLVPTTRPTINVNPTYGSHSALRGFGTLALFMSGTDQILIRSLESFGAGATPTGGVPEDRLFVALTHEYGHFVSNIVVSLARIPKWMSEGYAEYVAENLRPELMIGALRAGRNVSLDKASEIIEWGEDPGRNFTLSDIVLAYSESAHATQYFMDRFGQDRFFGLAKEFAETRRWDPSFQNNAGIAWPDFERDWLAWARQRYGL